MNPFRSPPAKLFSVDPEKLKSQFKTGQRCNACGTKIWSKNPGKISKPKVIEGIRLRLEKNDVTLNITAAILQLDFGIFHDKTLFSHRFSDAKNFFIYNSDRVNYLKPGSYFHVQRRGFFS